MRAVGTDGPKLTLVTPGMTPGRRSTASAAANSTRRVEAETLPALANTIGAAVCACEGCAPPTAKTAAISAEISSVTELTLRVLVAPAIFTPVQDFRRAEPRPAAL